MCGTELLWLEKKDNGQGASRDQHIDNFASAHKLTARKASQAENNGIMSVTFCNYRYGFAQSEGEDHSQICQVRTGNDHDGFAAAFLKANLTLPSCIAIDIDKHDSLIQL
eukprot:scaffold170892_cov18-Prasinocladus_malaysianus.AAC.1